MSVILAAHDVVKTYGAHRVLDGVTVTASPGHRVGLIGENGAGKSTLLRLLAGLEEPDQGRVVRPPDLGYLHQELPWPDHATVGTAVDHALAEVRQLRDELDQLAGRLERDPHDTAALARYGQVLQQATDSQAWDADRRADLVLAGLGLAGAGRDRPVGTLSGGERSRLGLAGLLIRQPTALLLDEPTNHLDDAALEFLQDHLVGLPGAVVLASHDRVLLDAVCTGLLDLDPSPTGATRYGGGYADYLRAKRIERRRWEERYAAQREELAALREAARTTARQVAHHRPMRDRNKTAYDRHGARVQAQVSRRVRNTQRRLDQLTRDQVRKPPAPLRFAAPLTGAGPGGGPVLSLRRVRVPGRLWVDHLDLPSTGRLLVSGPNGAGKSTLLAVLAAELVPASGTVTRRRGLRVGLLAQQVRVPEPERTAREVFAAAVPGSPVPLADLGLLPARDLDRPVGVLSLGQQRRLALAILVARAPQLVLLDEPTNHLSLTLVEELERALGSAPGAVVVASHDRWLRRRWTGARAVVTAEHRLVPD